MQVICLEEKAFYELIEQVVDRLKENYNEQKNKWVSAEEAMRILNIKSKTTLQELRDENAIRYSQPRKKVIAYDRDSIYDYFEKHANKRY